MLSPAKLSDFEDDRGNASDAEGGGNRSDEAIEDTVDGTDDSKKRKIDPKSSQKRIVRNPRPTLNAEKLKGPKGIHIIEQHFVGFKFRGKGHEKSDLNKLMKTLEYWSHRLFPRFEFDSCLTKLETLGTKKPVQTHLTKIRLEMLDNNDVIPNTADHNDEAMPDSVPITDFDALIAEEIEKHRYSVTPQRPDTSIFSTSLNKTPVRINKVSANVSSQSSDIEITADVQQRIERNRQIAIQKRLARFEAEKARKQAMEQQTDENAVPVVEKTNERTSPEEHTTIDTISDK